MAAVVGGVLCSLLLVVALSCACRVYAMRHHHYHGESGHQTPQSRVEAQMFRARPPPPSYLEAMVTSRPYDEVPPPPFSLLDEGGEDEVGASNGVITNNSSVSNESSQHSSCSSTPTGMEQVHNATPSFAREGRLDNAGNRHRRRHRQPEQQRWRLGGMSTAFSNLCLGGLHTVGLAPPPYSLMPLPPLAENGLSSTDSEEEEEDHSDAGDLDARPDRADALSEISSDDSDASLRSPRYHDSHSHPHSDNHSTASTSPDSSLISLREIAPDVHRLRDDGDTALLELSSDDCDKEGGDSNHSIDECLLRDTPNTGTSVVVDNVGTSLSSHDIMENREIQYFQSDKTESDTATTAVDEVGREDVENYDDDCACILAEDAESADESHTVEDGSDSICILK